MRDRSYRRSQRERIKKRWTKLAKRWDITDDNVRYEEGREGWVVRTMENFPTCSDPYCCGNPRKAGHKTRQEIKAEYEE